MPINLYLWQWILNFSDELVLELAFYRNLTIDTSKGVFLKIVVYNLLYYTIFVYINDKTDKVVIFSWCFQKWSLEL